MFREGKIGGALVTIATKQQQGETHTSVMNTPTPTRANTTAAVAIERTTTNLGAVGTPRYQKCVRGATNTAIAAA